MGDHASRPRSSAGRPAAAARAGVLGAAAAGPLAAGTVVLLADGLGGVVEVPGDVVIYMALSGLIAACLELPLVALLVRRHRHRHRQARLAALAGVLTAGAVVVAGLAPMVAVFASAMLLAGILAGPLLALPRVLAARLPGPDAFAWWQAAALTGLGTAAALAAVLAHEPGRALVVAGLAAAVLGGAAVLVPDPAPVPEDAPEYAPQAAPEADLPKVPVRAVASRIGRALPAYATAGLAIAVAVMSGLHLLLFRWELVGGEPVGLLAWAALPAVVLVVVARRITRTPDSVPWLLLAAAVGPSLMATAPGPVLLAVGFTVTLAAAALAAAALDTAVLGPLPVAQRATAAGLTAGVAVGCGLLGLGCVALLRSAAGDGSALMLMTLPLVAGALSALLVRRNPADGRSSGRTDVPDPTRPLQIRPDGVAGGAPAHPGPPLLDVRDLSAGPEASTGGDRIDRIDLTVRAGETVAVFGPGARLLLSALAGRVAPVGGTVRLGGADITTLPVGQRTALRLSHLVTADLFTGSAAQDVTVTGRLHGHLRNLGHPSTETTVDALLDVFPTLRARRHEPITALPEGPRRLLGLAEALVTRPRLLLVDAVSPGLGEEAAGAVLTVVRRLADEGGAVVLAEPVIPLALTLARRVYVLDGGRVTAELADPEPEAVHRALPPRHRWRTSDTASIPGGL